MENKLFNKSSMERIASPEKLNDYIRVANPSVWMVLAAIGLLLIALLVWGFFGSVSASTAVKGVVTEDGLVLCYIDANSDIHIEEGMEVAISATANTTVTGKVTYVSDEFDPVSYTDAAALLNNEYYLYSLSLTNWNTEIVITADSELKPGIYTVSITTESLRPIDMVFSN